MELELHQLELRYEGLRKRSPRRERQLIASLAEIGQQLPIVVLEGGEGGRRIVIDGYKRVRALRRLAKDTVRATVWQLEESEALLLDRVMRTAEDEGALEQGWLLRELHERFSLSCEQLAQRFDKSKSWVSRRLALVQELSEEIQQRVRTGELAPQTAMRYLVPLARANSEAADRLAKAIAPLKLSTRQVGELWQGWQSSDAVGRERLLSAPELYLKALEAAKTVERPEGEQLTSDLDAISGIARRILRRLTSGLWRRLSPAEREDATRCARAAQADTARLFSRVDTEQIDAGPKHTSSDPQAA
jgi:ParB/RepB/Spo0J family partition protein